MKLAAHNFALRVLAAIALIAASFFYVNRIVFKITLKLIDQVLRSAGLALAAFGALMSVQLNSISLADPATNQTSFVQATAGAISSTVPDGTCSANVTLRGGGGASSAAAGVTASQGGGGATIKANFKVLPLQLVSGTIGAGGTVVAAGVPGGGGAGAANGGNAGTLPTGNTHRGGGGGGSSDFRVAGNVLIVAGAGGGSGAAHGSSGSGGGGGFAGIAPGTVATGVDGVAGVQTGSTVGGGKGGQTAAGGAGGLMVPDGVPTYSGFAGGGIGVGTGGNGGNDTNPDTAGGGGGGYTGGGGGASTVQAAGTGNLTGAGAGGGGGSSFVRATSPNVLATAPTGVTGTAGVPTAAGSVPGAAGTVTADWVPCQYNLAVVKSVSPTPVKAGGKTTWTVTVTNSGPDPMTRGDTVSLADTLPVGPNGAPTPSFKVLSISNSGGSNADMASGAITCTGMTVGSTMPASTVCSRPYSAASAPGAPAGGTRGLDVGESLTITYEQIVSNNASCQTITNVASTLDRSTLSGTADIIGTNVARSASTPITLQCYDLGVTKTVSPTVATNGQALTWTVTVTNNGLADMQGPDDTTSNPLVVTDVAPTTNLSTPVSFTSTGPAGACTYAAGTITCPQSLSSGQSQVFTFSQTVSAGATNGSVLPNSASVVDFNPGDANDSASASATVAAKPTLRITKISNGGVGAFTFTGDNGWTSQAITTVTAGTGVTGAVQTLAAAGTVTTLTETMPAGYALAGTVCTGLGTGGTATVNPTTGTVTLDAAATAAGSVIACTVTNNKLPTVAVRKISNGGVGAFNFSGDNGWGSQTVTTVTSGTGVTGAAKILTAASTITNIAEVIPPGYVLSGISCAGTGAGNTTNNLAAGSVQIGTLGTAPGAVIVCTFTNTKSAFVKVQKTTAGAIGGLFTFSSTNLASTPSAITTTASGTATPAVPTAIAISTLGVDATVTEASVTGYALTSASCTDANSAITGNVGAIGNLAGNVLTIPAANVKAGSDYTCSFTNSKLPTLALTKISNGGVGAFTFTGDNGWASQTLTTTAAGSGVTGLTQTLAAASTSTTLTEAIPAGYVMESAVCSGLGSGGSAVSNLAAGTITLDSAATAAGSNIACTITNTKTPVIKVQKTTIGGVDGPFTFTQSNLANTPFGISTATAGTAAPAAPIAITINSLATDVTITENAFPGYIIASASCTDANSAVTGNIGTFGSLVGNVLTLPAANVVAGADFTCNFTNNNLPTLTLVKTVTNDSGGTLSVPSVTLTATGPTNISGVTAASAVTNALVGAGTYSLSESAVPGYVAGPWSCTSGTLTGSDLTLAIGENATCTVNNNDISPVLTLAKTITNDNGGTSLDTDFILTATGPTTISGATGAIAVTATNVNAGTYVLTESGPAGYTAGSWSCSAGTLTGNSLVLLPGQAATCTVNNNDLGPTLTLVKTITNDNGGAATVGDYILSAAGPTAISGITGTVSVSNAAVDAGTYTLSETGPAGYSAGAWSCTAGVLTGNSLALGLNQNATCTINNDDIAPKLTLVKSVTNAFGGTSVVSDFSLTATGPTPVTGITGAVEVTDASVSAGSYTLTESGPVGYAAGSWSCSAGTLTGNTLALNLNDNATCTINNADITPHLTLVKTVTNTNGGTATASAFTLTATGPTTITGLTSTGSVTNAAVNAGTYLLSESGPAGYTAGAWNCTAGTLTGNSLELSLNQSATCTINNSDIAPKLTLVKSVINDNGGTNAVADFTLSAAGPTPITGMTGAAAVTNASVSAGIYTLSETGPTGYVAGSWSCTAGTLSGSNVTLTPGQDATCSIVNNDVSPKLTLSKTVVNTHGGTAAAADFTLSATGPTSITGATGSASVTAATVNAGTYLLTESGPAGYSASAWSCSAGTLTGNSLVLPLNQSAICSVTNSDIAPHLTLVKTITNDSGGSALATAFTLAANGPSSVTGSTGSPGVTNAVVSAGTYSLSETGPAGYTSGSWSCVGGSLTGSNLTLALNQNATCTINNDDIPATITLHKVSNGDVGAFTFNGNNGFGSETLTTSVSGTAVDGTTKSLLATSTPTTITETIPEGFSLASATCAGMGPGGTATPNLITGALVLNAAAVSPGANVNCTFTNAQASYTNSKSASFASIAVPGPVSYTITVVNTGLADMTSPSISDSLTLAGSARTLTSGPTLVSGDSAPTGVFNVGETWTYTASYSVTQADLDAGGTLSNIATFDTLQTAPLASAPATTALTQTPALSIDKQVDAATPSFSAVGATINYNFVVLNSGNVTITSPISINDPKISPAASCTLPVAGLAPNASMICTGTSVPMTQADLDAGGFANTATATDGTITSSPDSVTVPAIQTPKMIIVKSTAVVPPSSFAVPGDTWHYNYVVTNTGNVTMLQPINVTDNRVTPGTFLCSGVDLAVGASVSCAASYVVQLEDIQLGSITNLAIAASANGTSPQTSLTIPPGATPALTITKSSPTLNFSTLPSTVTYNFHVVNSGGISLSRQIDVIDDKIGTIACFVPTIANPLLTPELVTPATSFVDCSATYNVTQADLDAGFVTNQVYAHTTFGATNIDVSSPPKALTVNANQNPILSLNKSVSPAVTGVLGQVLTYTISVKNDGNVTASSIAVTDPLIPTLTCSIPTLAPTITDSSCSGTYIVKQADIDAGFINNTANAAGTAPLGNAISGSGNLVTTVPQVSSLSVTKAQSGNADEDGSSSITLNDTLTYTVTATNTGTVTQNNVLVGDPKITPNSTTCLTLAPGASCILTGTYPVTQTDVDSGAIANIGSVKSDLITTPLAAPISTPVAQASTMGIVKALISNADEDTSSSITLGDTLTYQVTATNTGTVTQDNVVVTDSKITPASKTCISLLPAATCELSGTYSVTQADVDAGTIGNTGSVTSTLVTTPEQATIATPVSQSKTMSTVKAQTTYVDTDTSGTITIDDVLSYSVTASNTGTVTQTNVVVTDSKISPNSKTCLTVAPGDACILFGTYTVVQVDADAGAIANTGSLTSDIITAPKTSSVSTPVVRVIVASSYVASGINGATGSPSVVDAYSNDTLNGAPTTLATITGSVLTPGTPNFPGAPVPVLDPATGIVSVPPGTPAGPYTISYQICETANPTNCKVGTISITVDPSPIIAANDTVTGINGASGQANVVNAFTGDLINGVAASPSNSVLSVAPLSTVPTGLTFDPVSGDVSVAVGTPVGIYSFDYQICETLNPTNCKIATVSVTVVPPPIVATDDTPASINGATGGSTPSVLGNDTLNGNPITVGPTGNSTLTPGTAPTPSAGSITMNADGTVTVAAGTTAGTYIYSYEICEKLNPTNCKTATTTIVVDMAPMAAVVDTPPAINGATGGSTTTVLGNDTLNGNPVTIGPTGNSTLTPGIAPSPTAGSITMNPDGTVTVAAGTTAGSYTYSYTICENLNPTNCATTTTTIVVAAAPVIATNDSISGINGLTGQANVLNAFADDTINGLPASAANATLSIATPVPLGLTFDITTGNVSVDPATPAGTYTFDYQICETLNPTNCKIASVSVTVLAAPITADNDTPPAINGAFGGSTAAVITNDKLNGLAVTLGATGNITLTPGTAPLPAAGSITINADGTVTIAPGTTAGSYPYSYTICEKLNPSNCATATATIVVDAAPVVAINDSATGINGATGQANVLNAFADDTINGAPATPANAVLSVSTPVPAALTFDIATGQVSVVAGTAVGIYTFDYQICEALNPTNCRTATISVTVVPALILADNDTPPAINGASGGSTATVLSNDTLNSGPVILGAAGNAVLTPGVPPTLTQGLITMNPDGTVTVAAGTTAGSYPYSYTICEILNPTNCATASATIVVDPAPVLATNDTVTGINGLTGQADVLNAFAGDTINGVPATLANATLSVATPVPAGLVFNSTTGFVSVAAGTAAGTYTFDYSLCEILNPTNCKIATEFVTVVAAPILAGNDTPPSINGVDGGSTATVFSNDTLDGNPITFGATGNSTLTPGISPAPILGSITMNADGTVTVAAGTTAGSYPYAYAVCEKLNPGNCATAVATIVVDPATVVATSDAIIDINGASGQADVLNAFIGDTINGLPATAANAELFVFTPVPSGLLFDTTTGNVSVAAGTAAGVYSFDYQICEKLNPTNCKTATESVTVIAPPMAAVDDSSPDVNGAIGGSTPSVLLNDKLNAGPVIVGPTGNATLTPGTAPVPLAGSIIMNSDGTITVAAGTTAGSYLYSYTICEILNPTNCRTATATIVVDQAAMVATDDTPPAINGASGGSTTTVLSNDSLNGSPVIVGAAGNSTLTPGLAPSPPAGLITLNADGTVTVAAGTTAGTYLYPYTICEILNPLNCKTATATIVVDAAPVVATNDTIGGINGLTGQTNVLNAFADDTINGLPATNANAVLSLATGSSVPTGLTFNATTGDVSVDAGTAAGTYTFDYQICEILNPANCKIATVTVIVGSAVLVATDDTPPALNGASGGSTPSVLLNDTLNSGAVIVGATGNADLTPGTAPTPTTGLIAMNPDGTVTVAPGTTAGTYLYPYTICEKLNPLNCKTATATVVVDAAPVVATDDFISGINGLAGQTNVLNAFTGDTINGVPATTATAILTLAPLSAVPTGLAFDASTGNVSVDVKTPAGIYTFDYQICEILNPSNCKIASVSVTVVAAPLVAIDDAPPAIVGATGGSTATVLVNDTLDGAAVTVGLTGNATLTAGLAPTPTAGSIAMNPDGTVTVAAGTTAGTYLYPYTICETLNPLNCKTAIATIVVDAAPVVATNDVASGINGLTGAVNVLNAFTADTINGLPATAANAVLSLAPLNAVPTGLTFVLATGDVSVAAGTPAGTFAFDYQICETLNPANCSIATISVTVDAAALIATNDTPPAINGASGGSTPTVLGNDTLNASPITVGATGNSTLTPGTAPTPTAGSISMNPDGTVTVAAGTTAGSYPYSYTICEKLNPLNCKTAVTTIIVDAATIVATNDTVTGINGLPGQTNVLNAFASDTINGLPATASNAVLTLAPASTIPAGLIFDATSGDISVAPATAAGTYTFDYQICELLNPTNCKIASVSVTVVAADLLAVNDLPPAITGATGGSAATVLNNDTLNGAAVTVGVTGNSDLAPGTAPAPAAGSITMNADGTVTVAPGTTAGSYPYLYTLCEKLNPLNCKTATATIIVDAAPVVATSDTITGIDGVSGALNVLNAFTGDTVNGAAATPANAVLSLAPLSTVPTGLTFDDITGNVSVAAGTPAGVYSFDYQVCELLNPTNCKTATETVTVAAAPIVAADDTPPALAGATGGTTLSVLGNDTLNGAAVNVGPTGNILLTPGTAPAPAAGSIAMNPDGTVTVAPGTTAGSYLYDYTICEKLNPGNCKTATATIVVDAAPIAALSDTVIDINGLTGQANVLNAFAGDTIGGLPATPVNATLSVAPLSTVPVGLSFDPTTGDVSVDPATPAGLYSFDYQICEKLNPANCTIATETVTVIAASLVAVDDTPPAIPGGTGGTTASVLTNDTLNGIAAILGASGNAVLTSGTAPVPARGSIIMNPDGTVTVAANTSGGTYLYPYTICEILNPLNCKTATTTIVVSAASVTATSDTATGINGLSGQSNVLDAFAGDTINGAPATAANASLSLAVGSTVPAGLSFNPATGLTSVAAGTASGVYSFDYTICEKLNPANCQTATETITVDPALSGTVFHDENSNGVLDASDTPAGVGYLIELVDSAGTVVGSALTGPSGTYGISAPAGTYSLIFKNPAGIEIGRSTNVSLTIGGVPQNFDLPLAPSAVTAAGFTKVALKSELRRGESVVYVISARGVLGSPVQIVDLVPQGFAFVANSATVNGIAVTPTVNANSLTFSGLVPAAGVVKLQLTLVTTAAVASGPSVNNARLIDQNNGIVLAKAQATVTVMPDHVFDCGDIIGKVFDDKNRNGYQDEGERGLPGVRVATVKGQLVTTDKSGRFHVGCADLPDAKIGSNFVMKLDTRTLPTGYRLTTENPRDVRLTAGKVTKLNFGASITRVVKLDLNGAVFKSGSTDLRSEWQSQLGTLIRTLGVEPSTLRLTYYLEKDGRTLANKRVTAVEAMIARMWKREGNNYKLPIETRVIGVDGAPAK